MSYDVKYRKRAIGYWEEGHSKRATAIIFNVNANTLQNWKTQLKETGSLEPKKRRETWRKVNPERLAKYVEEHPDAYLKEIAEEFNCTPEAILYALRRLKISRKKNYQISRSEREFST
jgi:transposase